MVQFDRVRVGLTGFVGAPGLCTFYALDGPSLVGPLQTMWNALVGQMPGDVRVQVESIGDRLESSTGALVGAWATASVPQLSGSDAAPYPAPCGFGLTWVTNGLVHSHHVRGRTFVVPGGGGIYQADGSLAQSNVAAIGGVAATFVAATVDNFVVWSRPFVGTPATATRPANPARVGSTHGVVGTTVRDKVVVLRSRRD